MAIRELPADELYKLMPLGAKFWPEGKLPGKLIPEVFCASWGKLIELGVAHVLAVEVDGKVVGVLGLITVPDLNDGELVANEGFWFVEPEHRGEGYKLLVRAESLAMQKGCKRMGMVHLSSINADTLEKIYLRRGYTRAEVHYLKNL